MKRHALLLCLLIISSVSFAETAVYTVESRVSVKAGGDIPVGSYAEYQQGGNSKSHLTSGNAAELLVYGFDGYRIESVTLSMHSNKSAGGGGMYMTVGDSVVWYIEDCNFNNPAWYGSWSSEYVSISKHFSPPAIVGKAEAIRIFIIASVNSLYIESFTIEYKASPTERFSVSLATANSSRVTTLHESSPGGGVVLPAMSGQNGWFFIGWTEQLTTPRELAPEYWRAGSTYYPAQNTTLYALYCNKAAEAVTSGIVQTTQYEDGLYILGSTRLDIVMDGVPVKNRINSYEASTTQKNQDSLYTLVADSIPMTAVYILEFDEDSTAYIYNVKADRYISPPLSNSSSFTYDAEPWSYRVLADSTILFYKQFQPYPRVLYGQEGTTAQTLEERFFTPMPLDLGKFKNRGMVAFPFTMPDNQECLYSSYIDGSDVESCFIHGIYTQGLCLCNPLGQEITVHTVGGHVVYHGYGDAVLPAQGIYIVRSGNVIQKILAQ